jgi:hypothetical protein
MAFFSVTLMLTRSLFFVLCDSGASDLRISPVAAWNPRGARIIKSRLALVAVGASALGTSNSSLDTVTYRNLLKKKEERIFIQGCASLFLYLECSRLGNL